jgi:hypothetical protein
MLGDRRLSARSGGGFSFWSCRRWVFLPVEIAAAEESRSAGWTSTAAPAGAAPSGWGK